MNSRILCLVLFALTAGCVSTAQADSIECAQLNDGELVTISLESADGFNNCLALTQIPPNTEVVFSVGSPNQVQSKTTLYDTSGSGPASYISEYSTDQDGADAFKTNTGTRDLAFRIIPSNFRSSDKVVTIGFVILPEQALVTIFIDNHQPPEEQTVEDPNPSGDCDPLTPWHCDSQVDL
ncbi:MAG: hypothetical protein AAFS02_11980 [Pseudomonadota bacterium]